MRLSCGRKKGDAVTNSKISMGTRLDVVTVAIGLTLGMTVADANSPEHKLREPAEKIVPLPVPQGTPVIAGTSHDCGSLRDELEAEGLVPVIPHRKGRMRPSRIDSRRPRRYRRPWVVERTHARWRIIGGSRCVGKFLSLCIWS